MKTAAVVVTHNRLELLKECIASLRAQTFPLNEIIVVNNDSTDGTADWLKSQADITAIHQGNLGSSGGQYTGIKKAVEGGADWIWCMDDDAMPYDDALQKLIPHCNTEKVAALACTVLDNEGNISRMHRGYFNYKALGRNFGCEALPQIEYHKTTVKIGYATFVGMMISKKAVDEAGLPKKDIFLHFDDIEYSLRLRETGKILLVPESKILHKEKASDHFYMREIFGKPRMRIKFEKLWLRFYVIRNVTWGVKKYYGNKWDTFFILFGYLLKSLAGIILFDDHKIKRIRFFIAAFSDGMSARFHNGYEYINKRTRLYS